MKKRISNGGNTGARLKRVQEEIGLSNRQMAQLLRTSPNKVAGWVQSDCVAFRAEQMRQLVRLDLMLVLAAKVYPENKVRAFFATPLAEFDNKSATDLLLEGNFQSVVKTITAAYEG